MKKKITYSIGENKNSLDIAGLKWSMHGTEFTACHAKHFVIDGIDVHAPGLDADIVFITDATYDDDFIVAVHDHAVMLQPTYKYQEAMVLNVLNKRLKLKHYFPVPTWRSSHPTLEQCGTAYDWQTKSAHVIVKDYGGAMGFGQFKIVKKDFDDNAMNSDRNNLSHAEFAEKYNVTGGQEGAKRIADRGCIITEELPIVAEFRLMKTPKGAIYGYRRGAIERVPGFRQACGTTVTEGEIMSLKDLITFTHLVPEITKLANALLPNKHGSMDLALVVTDPDGPITNDTVKWSVFEYGYQFGCNLKGGGTWFRDFMRQCIYEYAELEGL